MFNRIRGKQRDTQISIEHIYVPNHFWVGAIDRSDRFEHIFDPQCIWKLFEKILQTRFWKSVLKTQSVKFFQSVFGYIVSRKWVQTDQSHLSHRLRSDLERIKIQRAAKPRPPEGGHSGNALFVMILIVRLRSRPQDKPTKSDWPFTTLVENKQNPYWILLHDFLLNLWAFKPIQNWTWILTEFCSRNLY